MKNLDVIEKFRDGARAGKTQHLYIDGDNLVNDATVIAKRVDGGVILNTQNYSRTTSRIQNMIRNTCNIVAYTREF